MLTFQGNWGLFPSVDVDLAKSDDEVTKEIQQLPEVVEKCIRFGAHCKALAHKLEAAHTSASVEICLKTFRKEHQLRLH